MKILKYVIALTAIFYFTPSYAGECNLGKLGIGKNFSEIRDEFSLNGDNSTDAEFTKAIMGNKICDALKNADISLEFMSGELVRAYIYKVSDDMTLFNIVRKKLGKPSSEPNTKSGKESFSTYWAADKDLSAMYGYKIINDKYDEKLVIQKRHFQNVIIGE